VCVPVITHWSAFVAQSGRHVEVRGATFSESGDDGLDVRDTHYIDVATLLRQLGVD
jgi:hypothetical protein